MEQLDQRNTDLKTYIKAIGGASLEYGNRLRDLNDPDPQVLELEDEVSEDQVIPPSHTSLNGDDLRQQGISQWTIAFLSLQANFCIRQSPQLLLQSQNC